MAPRVRIPASPLRDVAECRKWLPGNHFRLLFCPVRGLVVKPRCIGRGACIETSSKGARRSREGDKVRIGRVTLYRQHGAGWRHIRESRAPVCQRVGSAWGRGGAGCGAGELLPPGIGGSLAGGSRLNGARGAAPNFVPVCRPAAGGISFDRDLFCYLGWRVLVGWSFIIRSKLYVAAASSQCCLSFHRPNQRLLSNPAIVFSHPNPSSIFLRTRWLTG